MAMPYRWLGRRSAQCLATPVGSAPTGRATAPGAHGPHDPGPLRGAAVLHRALLRRRFARSGHRDHRPPRRFALQRADQAIVVTTPDWICAGKVLGALDYLRRQRRRLTLAINQTPSARVRPHHAAITAAPRSASRPPRRCPTTNDCASCSTQGPTRSRRSRAPRDCRGCQSVLHRTRHGAGRRGDQRGTVGGQRRRAQRRPFRDRPRRYWPSPARWSPLSWQSR